MIHVLIVEEHKLVRQALETRLRVAEDLEILPSVGDYTHAVRQAQALRPDIILLETKTNVGLETLSALRASAPWAKVIILTSYPDSREEEEALKLGASAYLLKTLDTKALVNQIESSAHALANREFLWRFML